MRSCRLYNYCQGVHILAICLPRTEWVFYFRNPMKRAGVSAFALCLSVLVAFSSDSILFLLSSPPPLFCPSSSSSFLSPPLFVCTVGQIHGFILAKHTLCPQTIPLVQDMHAFFFLIVFFLR